MSNTNPYQNDKTYTLKIKNILEQKLIRSEKITIQLINNSMHLKKKKGKIEKSQEIFTQKKKTQ